MGEPQQLLLFLPVFILPVSVLGLILYFNGWLIWLKSDSVCESDSITRWSHIDISVTVNLPVSRSAGGLMYQDWVLNQTKCLTGYLTQQHYIHTAHMFTIDNSQLRAFLTGKLCPSSTSGIRLFHSTMKLYTIIMFYDDTAVVNLALLVPTTHSWKSARIRSW